jgi:mannose-1-phosphate guanylyltransferase
MKGRSENPQSWAILLAGGEGTRLASFTRTISGETMPKQFCTLVGNQSMLEQTRTRVSSLFREDRILCALTCTQERFYAPIVRDIPSENLIIQPQNKGTAPAILYALLRLSQLDPLARVALFPCDHFVDDDCAFMSHVELALDVTNSRPELTVLLGIAADRPETSYGWIERGEAIDAEPVFSVRQFWEKPNSDLAAELLKRECLWNSSVIVARVSTLLGLFMIALPSLYLSFRILQGTFGRTFEADTARRLYEYLTNSSFSDDVLVRHGVNLGVLPVTGVQWNDLGEPHRVVETVHKLGLRPASQAA